MSTEYSFSMDLRVVDPEALHAAALEHLTDVDGLDKKAALDIIGPAEAPKIGDCLVAILDPGHLVGCSIHGSSAEAA